MAILLQRRNDELVNADNVTPSPQFASSGSILTAAGRNFARMIARDSRRFILIVLVAAGLGWIVSYMQAPVYQASALAAISPRAEELEPNELLRGMEVLERRTIVETVAALAATPTTRAQVSASGYSIQASVVSNTNLFRVTVQGANAARAAAIANLVPQVLSTQTQTIYRYYRVSVVSPATAPSEPFRPRPALAAAAGLLIGIFLGVLAAFVTQRRYARAAITS